MSPLSGISPNLPGTLPGVNLVSPEMTPLSATSELGKSLGVTAAQPAGGDSFATMLGQMVSDINAQQVNATQTVNALQSGQKVPLHQAVIAMEEANVSFQLMVEVRNRLLESYQAIMQMQI